MSERYVMVVFTIEEESHKFFYADMFLDNPKWEKGYTTTDRWGNTVRVQEVYRGPQMVIVRMLRGKRVELKTLNLQTDASFVPRTTRARLHPTGQH